MDKFGYALLCFVLSLLATYECLAQEPPLVRFGVIAGPQYAPVRIGRINHVSGHSGKYVSPITDARYTP